MSSLTWTAPIIELKDSDFSGRDLKNKKPGYIVLLVYADWCGHCRDYHDTFQNVANMTRGHSNVRLAVLEDKNSKKFKQHIEVRGVPSIFIYTNGTDIKQFGGNRDHMLDYVNMLQSTPINSK